MIITPSSLPPYVRVYIYSMFMTEETSMAVIAFSLFSPVRLFKTTMLQIFQMSKSPFYATRKKSSSQVHLGKLYCTCRDRLFTYSSSCFSKVQCCQYFNVQNYFFILREKIECQVHLGKLYCTCRDRCFPVFVIKQNEGGHF